MRGIIERTLMLGAVLGAGAMLAPLIADAAGFGHGGFFSGQPLVRPGQAVLRTAGAVPLSHLAGWDRLHHHRRALGLALPVAGGGPYDIAPPAPAEVDPGTTGSLGAVPRAGDRLSDGRGGCRIETRIVPAEAGGMRNITITSCRPG